MIVRLPRKLPYRLDPGADLGRGLAALEAALTSLDPWRTTVAAAALFQAPLARLAGWQGRALRPLHHRPQRQPEDVGDAGADGDLRRRLPGG